MTTLRQIPITGLILALLIGAVFANLWFASAPLPLGGPNGIIAAAAALLAILYAAARIIPRTPSPPNRPAGLSALTRDFRPLLPALTVSLLLLLWALTVYLRTDTLAPTTIAKMAVGIGIMFAVYLAVNTPQRARLLTLAIIAATFASALWGMAVAFIGEPFLSLWQQIASVRELDLYRIFTEGRVTGFLPYASTFGYQLAAAIPITFAALICGPFGQTQPARRIYDAILFVILIALIAALVMNATRAAILGLLITAVIIIAPSLFLPHFRRRLFVIALLISLPLLAFSDLGLARNGVTPLFGSDVTPTIDAANANANNPGAKENPRGIFSYSDWAAQSRKPLAATALRYSLDHPLGAGAYRPNPSHAPTNLDPESLNDILNWQPHNQFLNMLAIFGFPGLLLLTLFYALTAKSLLHSTRQILRQRDTNHLFLLIAITGAMTAYFIVSMFHPTGPFLDDWSHFFIIGLAFSLHRLTATHQHTATRQHTAQEPTP